MFSLDAKAPNIFPQQYRQVALSYDAPSLDEDALKAHFLGRDAYMRTRFIIARVSDEAALVEVATADSDDLFSPITDVRVLAAAIDCAWIEQPQLDVGVASQFVPLVADHPQARCLIVEGLYSHVSFLLNPKPLWIEVLDIVPPAPSKLADQAQRILDLAEELPPLGLRIDAISSLDLLAQDPPTKSHVVLLPCRTTDVELDGLDVAYLDQRPPKQDWTLLGCHRSGQIHESFYGGAAPRIDTCPRRLLSANPSNTSPTLTRCCLLQQGQERDNRTVLVPWGSSLREVRLALETLIEIEGFEWTPT